MEASLQFLRSEVSMSGNTLPVIMPHVGNSRITLDSPIAIPLCDSRQACPQSWVAPLALSKCGI